ncbi:MAG: CBS domain-containing protein [Chloroflexales bacterium]
MFFLAHLLGGPIRGKNGELIGTLDDLLVQISDAPYPPVIGLVAKDRGRRFFVPVQHLETLNGITRLNSSVIDLQPFRRRDGEVLLGKDVLDHQIIDIGGRRLVRVNDVQITLVERTYRVIGVDISPQALLRRLGPRAFADKIVGRQIIDWGQAQYLASAAPVQLKVSYDRLTDLHPVDLARIMDALSLRESTEIVAGLDDETAAEALEEVSDERVADILEELDHERAADILEEMEPSAAADALEDLDDEVADRILAQMEPEDAADVQALLAYDENSAGRIMTTDTVQMSAETTVGEAMAAIRAMEEVPDPLLAVYVVRGDPQRLCGIVRLRQMITGEPEMLLEEVMEADIPSVRPDDRAEDAARLLAEYNLLAIPVIDDQGYFIGVVTVDDALAVLLPEIWQRRGARIFS